MTKRRPALLGLIALAFVLLSGGLFQVHMEGDSPIRINELVAASGDYRPRGLAWDWVEITNSASESLTLDGLYLSDEEQILKKWAFPAHLKLKAGGFLQILLPGEELLEMKEKALLCTAFSLPRKDGLLLLTDGLRVLDRVAWAGLPRDVSYGRPAGQKGFLLLDTQTPGFENPLTGYTSQLEAPSFSVAGGCQQGPVTLQISSPKGEIRYTLDGKEPDSNSALYTGALTISQNTVLRARCFHADSIKSPVSTDTYLFEAPIPGYTVCVSGDPDSFFGPSGIFVRGNWNLSHQNRGHMELLKDGKTVLNEACSFALTGGSSLKALPRSFTLYARGGLGEDAFWFNPFPERDSQSHKAFTLRTGGTESRQTEFRDAFLCSLFQGRGIFCPASQPCAVYLNGSFWGAFHLREKINQSSIARYEGLLDDKIKDQIIILKNKGFSIHGDGQELRDLAQFCRENDLSLPSNLAHVEGLLDLDSVLTHSLCEMLVGNMDMQNVRYYKLPQGKWKMVLFDLDNSVYNTNPYPMEIYTRSKRNPTGLFYDEIFPAILEAPSVRERFLELAGKLIRDLPKDLVLKKADAWKEGFWPMMRPHILKWGNIPLDSYDLKVEAFKSMLAKRLEIFPQNLVKAFHISDEEAGRWGIPTLPKP